MWQSPCQQPGVLYSQDGLSRSTKHPGAFKHSINFSVEASLDSRSGLGEMVSRAPPDIASPGRETEQDPVGLLSIEAFQTVTNQEREGIQRQGRSSQETIVIRLPWWRSG